MCLKCLCVCLCLKCPPKPTLVRQPIVVIAHNAGRMPAFQNVRTGIPTGRQPTKCRTHSERPVKCRIFCACKISGLSKRRRKRGVYARVRASSRCRGMPLLRTDGDTDNTSLDPAFRADNLVIRTDPKTRRQDFDRRFQISTFILFPRRRAVLCAFRTSHGSNEMLSFGHWSLLIDPRWRRPAQIFTITACSQARSTRTDARQSVPTPAKAYPNMARPGRLVAGRVLPM
jgi:hypothetical protein